jgi:probable HAF family extracellular repeat protein
MVVFGSENAFADYLFSTIDVPGTFQTIAFGINNSGQIVGLGNPAFLYSDGSFINFNYPGANQQTEAHGINNLGQIVGQYVAEGSFHGFLNNNGSFTSIGYPGASDTFAYGINDSGQIVGYFFDGTEYRGFLDSGDSFTSIRDPYASCPPTTSICGTFATGINNLGQIVGYFGDTAGVTHGFVYSGGSFTTIDYPGVSCPGLPHDFCGTFASGINDADQVVGSIRFSISSGHGFLDVNGSFTTIQDPNNPDFTLAYGTNDSGQIVGEFEGTNFPAPHGFLATPIPTPEPPSLVALATSVVTLLAMAWWRNAPPRAKKSSNALLDRSGR